MSGLLQSASICCHKWIRPTIITQCCSLYWNRYCIMHRLQNAAEQIPLGRRGRNSQLIITQCCSLYWNRYCIMHRLQNAAEQIPLERRGRNSRRRVYTGTIENRFSINCQWGGDRTDVTEAYEGISTFYRDKTKLLQERFSTDPVTKLYMQYFIGVGRYVGCKGL